MNCLRYRDLFSAYLEGELSPAAKKELEAHLESCPACSHLFRITAQLGKEIQNLPEVEPPAELLARLYQIPQTAASRQKKVKASFSWKFWLSPGWQPVLATLTVILVLMSFIFFTTPGKTVKKSAALELHRGYSQAQKLLVRTGLVKDKLDGYRENFLASLEAKNMVKSE